MPSSCLVCREEGDKGYFTLPKNRDRRLIWIEKAKLGDWYDENRKPHHRVCYKHFLNEDIKYQGKKVLLRPG